MYKVAHSGINLSHDFHIESHSLFMNPAMSHLMFTVVNSYRLIIGKLRVNPFENFVCR